MAPPSAAGLWRKPSFGRPRQLFRQLLLPPDMRENKERWQWGRVSLGACWIEDLL